MAILRPTSDQEYGALTNWSREVPVASTIGWAVHHTRNALSKLPILDKVKDVTNRVI